jgi:hypothetical protein
MPRYEVNAPDGQRFEVDAPEGATLEDAFAYVQSNLWTPLDVQAKKKRTWGEAAGDIGGSLTKGVGQLAQLPGQVAGLVTGNIDPDTGLQGVGKQIEQFGEELKSPTLKARQTLASQKIGQADGLLNEFGTAIKTYATDPMLATSFVAEQLPNLLGAGAGGAATKVGVKAAMRGATKEALETTLPKAAVRGAVGTGAVMQGADIGTDTFDSTFKGLVDGGMSAIEAYPIALQKGRVAAIEAGGLSVATAFLPGGTAIERALVGKGMPGAGGFLKGALGEALSEGIEEGGGAFAKNVGMQEALPETSLTKGVGAAAGLGALGGALFGGPAGAITGMQDADRNAAIQAVRDQHQQVINAENEAAAAVDQARRDAYAAEQAATEMRIMQERLGDQFTQSQAYADLSAQVEAAQLKAQAAADKIQAAQAKVDAGKAQLSAFAEAQPDLFGMVYPKIQEQAAAEQQARAEQAQAGQMELPLEAQASLGLEAPVQPARIPEAEQELAPVGRLVNEADFKAMGVGSTNKKLREQILGKDLADPAQAQEVKDILENYASGDRSERIIQGVTKFIDGIKTPQEQLGLGLRRPYGSMKKPVPVTETPIQEEVANVGEPVEAIPGIIEPSIPEPVVRRRAAPTKAVVEATGRGVVPTGGIAGLPVGREGNVPSALSAYDQGAIEGAKHKDTNKSIGAVPEQGSEEANKQYVEGYLDAKWGKINRKTKAETPAPKAKPKKAPVAVNPFGQLVEAVAPESKPDLTEDQARAVIPETAEETLSRLEVPQETSAETEELMRQLGIPPKLQREGTQGASSESLTSAVAKGDLRSALGIIAQDTSGTFNPLEVQIAKRLLANKGSLPKIEVVSNLDSSGLYNPFTDTIQIKEGEVDSHTVLHEATHGFLHALIEKFEKDGIKNKGITDLKGVYDFIAKEQPNLMQTYGMTSLSEFASEVMSNREFQAELAQIPYRRENALTAFIKAVLNALGISPNEKFSALASALVATDSAMAMGRKVQEDVVTGKETLPKARVERSNLEDIDRRAGYSNVKPDPKQGIFKTLKGTDKKQIESGTKNFLNKAETMYFSSDAALQNAIRKGMEDSGMNWEDQKRMMFMNATSQALHPDAVAMQLLQEGGVEYEKDTYKWKAVKKDDSWQSLIKDISTLGKKYGVSTEEMSNYAHRAFISDRLKGLTGSKEDFYSHKTPEQIAAGMEYFKAIPELRKLQESWNKVRANAMDAAVEGGLYSRKQADELLDIMDYVPFFRMEQLEAKRGPKEYGRGLLDFAKGYKIRGSEDEVNNIFDNMERWVSYTVSRAVKNRTALNLYETAKEYLPEGEVVDLRQDDTTHKEQNIIDLWENGQRKKVEFKDPLFVHAFQGVEGISIPVFKSAAAVANILRKNIVLMPLFSVSQLSQDSIGAMFTSGLRNPFSIPIEVVKEFTKTLRGTSATHAELSKYGAVGVRDYSAAIARNDAEIVAGLAAPTKFQKILSPFEKFAMASDNAVRQAVYNLTMKETNGDKAAAIEKAFEIINFKRSGASGGVQVLKQVVPFFGAYLQAQNVAYKTIMGKGISPSQKKEAQRVLMSTSAKIAALAFIYAAICADDDDYQKMDPTIRDRHLLIPGTGFMLPLRPDVFILPKLAAEYAYQSITDQGFTDGKKMRRGMFDAVTNAILSPTIVPQAVKPLAEVMVNYNFFTGRPLVGMGIENKVTAEQFTNTTSELAKFLGKAGIVAPVNIDHLIKGYLGTTGGIALQATSAAANIGSNVPTPEKSLQDTLASTPGLSAFFVRENGAALKNDYYELRGEVDKAVATYNNMVKTGRGEEAKEFFGENKELFAVKSQVNTIERQLTKLRDRSKVIYASTKMSSEEKGAELDRIKQMENRMLANINDIRRRAGY